jgi:hypothetical protein
MRRTSALAAVADIVGVLVFCAVGRQPHRGLTLTDVAEASEFIRADEDASA